MDTYSECNGCQTTWAAAKNGHLECLKYLHKNGCPWDEDTTWYAALNGNLKCLKYLHENGCPWDENATCHAAYEGQLECLKYLHQKGCPWDQAPIGSKVKIWWKMVQDIVKTRPIVFYWLEKTTISSYSENGRGRKRDREEFSQFVEINF